MDPITSMMDQCIFHSGVSYEINTVVLTPQLVVHSPVELQLFLESLKLLE